MPPPVPVPVRTLPLAALPPDLQGLVLAGVGWRLLVALLLGVLTLLPVLVLLACALAVIGSIRPLPPAVENGILGLVAALAVVWMLGALAGGLRWALGARFGPYRLGLVSYGGEGGFTDPAGGDTEPGP